ncbi:MAG: hypothetical protein KY439_08645 [Actinobacteria bacterium]|nr:hypothetical protein [Actinomycetota bacterium]
MRRLLLASVILGLAMASLALPAAGQTATPVDIVSISPVCGPVGGAPTVTVKGTAGPGVEGGLIAYAPDDTTTLARTSWFAGRTRNFTASITFKTTTNGYYRLTATDGSTSDSAYFSAPCRNPRVALDPDCSVPGQTTSLTVSAFDFAPNDRGYVYFDYSGPNDYGQARIRIPIDPAGNFATTAAYKSGPFSVTPPDRDVPIRVEDLRGNVVDVSWPRCPPPGVTPTTTTTTRFTPDPTPDPTPDTTMRERVTIPSTTIVTLPPDDAPVATTSTSVVVPPPTAGASLTLTPPLGPPGVVTLAAGAGFPPGPVTLAWSRGLGTTFAMAGPDGTFAVGMLVFPKDRLGPRTAVASGGGVSANAEFLVVPPTVQPSASDVTQITRIRRFTHR